MRAQLTGNVNVEVDAAPQQDLNKVLDEIRSQYEAITEKHRKDQEAWFTEQVRVSVLFLRGMWSLLLLLFYFINSLFVAYKINFLTYVYSSV